MSAWLRVLVVGGTTLTASSSRLVAQITRDVDEVAIIEGDANIVYTSTDGNGQPCSLPTVDFKQLAQKFYQTHADVFTQLIIFTTFDHQKADCGNVGPYSVVISNAITGLGIGRVYVELYGEEARDDLFDFSSDYGSDGVLEAYVQMDNVNDFPADPNERLANSTGSVASLLAQEVGHRWGAYVWFDSDPGSGVTESGDLIGRQNAHWSFFANTASVTSTPTNPKASSLLGNFWVETSPGSGFFQTETVTDGYSELDLYLMGLVPASRVGPFWYLADVSNSPKSIDEGSIPQNGVVLQGTQTFVTVDNVITVEGVRNPSSANSPKCFRHAFILLTHEGVDATQDEIDKVRFYRRSWETYFAHETQNAGAVIALLGDTVFVDAANPGGGDGSIGDPYPTVEQGRDNVTSGGTVVIKAGTYAENLTFSGPMTLRSALGSAFVGD